MLWIHRGQYMTKQDKTRQLSIEQANALEHLLQGQSDRAVAEAVNDAEKIFLHFLSDEDAQGRF